MTLRIGPSIIEARQLMRKALRKYRVPLRPFLAQLRGNYPSKPHPCLPDHDYEAVNKEFLSAAKDERREEAK